MLSSLLSGPVVELVDVKEGQVILRSRKRLTCDRPLAVRIATGQGRTVTARVQVNHHRPLGRGFACQARLETPLPPGTWKPAAGSDPFLRQAPRRDCPVRVMSPLLPECRGVDFSTGGVQVEAGASVTVGREIPVRLHLEGASVECLARVAWTAPRAEGRTALGLQFVHLDAEERHLLERHALFLAGQNPQRQATGRIVSYSVEGNRALVWFETAQGPTLKMSFERYQGLSDRHQAVGREIFALRDLEGRGCMHFQFLDAQDRVVLEVRALSCQNSST